MRIELIVNARALQFRRDARLIERVGRTAARRARLHVTRDLADLRRVCESFRSAPPDVVVLAGGDGTLMASVTELARVFGPDAIPAVAPIPGGTAGTVARNWGVRGSPTECLDRLLTRPVVETERPSLVVEGHLPAGSAHEQRIGFIVGTGLVAQFFELYYDRGAPGYAGAARIVARVFAESFYGGAFARRVLDPLPCRLAVDGARLEPRAWSLVCASVVVDLGIHMRVNYRADEDPTRLHLVASPLSARQLGPRAPYVVAGRSIGGRGHVDRLVRSFAVEFGRLGPYVLDGELLRAGMIEVRPGPRIRVVTSSRRPTRSG